MSAQSASTRGRVAHLTRSLFVQNMQNDEMQSTGHFLDPSVRRLTSNDWLAALSAFNDRLASVGVDVSAAYASNPMLLSFAAGDPVNLPECTSDFVNSRLLTMVRLEKRHAARLTMWAHRQCKLIDDLNSEEPWSDHVPLAKHYTQAISRAAGAINTANTTRVQVFAQGVAHAFNLLYNELFERSEDVLYGDDQIV